MFEIFDRTLAETVMGHKVKSILIVDDEATMRITLEDVLEAQGYTTQTQESGK